jgi:uncharacterized protein (TIGR02598 family)
VKNPICSTGNLQRAFSLVEVTIALGIVSFCLIAILGLLPAGLNTNKASVQQNAAANLASLIASDLRSTPATTNRSTCYGLELPAGGTGNKSVLLDESGAVASDAASAVFLATVTVVAPASGVTASSARILITWPAAADITKASGSFETVVGLNRN